MSVLVTGGAGYIGSHMVRELLRRGEPVVVVDNLATGHRDAVPKQVPFLHADIRARSELTAFLRRHQVSAILHFAARSLVGESMVNPRRYYRDNLTATVDLLELALDENIGHFVLSSTAAVYGDPRQVPMDESHPTVPVNPYGSSKLALEQVLADYHRSYGLRFAALRYFNACGAEPEFGLGERHEPETHLLPLVIGAALGTRPPVTIFGTDYPTPDGTCIRDYVHVRDLAEAHMEALAYLRQGGASGSFNLGTGVGHSVHAVIAAVEDVTGRPVPKTVGPRRPGDPPALVASPEKARTAFGWVAQRADLRTMVADAYAFHRTQVS